MSKSKDLKVKASVITMYTLNDNLFCTKTIIANINNII